MLKLQQAGFEVWFDLQRLTPGIDWSTALQEGYGNCERLVFIASQAALQSPYVRVEWESALQNQREIIVILTEPVELPPALQGCPVFDARTQFEARLDDLIRYLRGSDSARHDPVPLPGRSLFLNRIPFAIWLTVAVMLMPAITAWVATLGMGLTTLPITVDLGLPEWFEPSYSGTLLGFVVGLILISQYPIRSFLEHDVSHEALSKLRYKLFPPQLAACLLCWVFTVVYPKTPWAVWIGYLAWGFPLVTAYWSFRMLPHSPDILRWMPSGLADQEVRTRLGGMAVQVEGRSRGEGVTYAIHAHPADVHIVRLVDSIFSAQGLIAVGESLATIQVMIVSNRTSKKWLLACNAELPGEKIHILATNINTPPELQPILQTQWIDFRSEREAILRAFAAHRLHPDELNVSYALEISPMGFDNGFAFPRPVRLLLGAFLLAFILAFLFLSNTLHLPDWLFIPCSLPLILYMDGLLMRRYPLPDVFHRVFGRRAAWFAHSAPSAEDAIGNTDRKYITDQDFLLLVDVLKK